MTVRSSVMAQFVSELYKVWWPSPWNFWT